MTRQGRVAFLLNANAKSVTKNMLRGLSSLIPKDDLYASRSLSEAERNIATILDRDYAYIFCGGGDGTVVSAINLLNDYQKATPLAPIPKIGVLGLGTGNALARFLGAKKPKADVKRILSGKSIKPVDVSMIETNAGQLTPFAGVGFDGELLNDFESMKDIFFESPFRKFFASVLGFSIAGFFKTLPRQVARIMPIIRVNSSYPCYRIMEINGVDEEIFIDDGRLLFDGTAPLVCVGTIPSVGYGITMFPFANKRPGYMHLRVSAVPIATCIAHIYPGIWHGHFRHKKLFDYLVKDVTIESEESLPYQLGGDSMGYKKQLYFRVSSKPVAMARLYGGSSNLILPSQPAMMPLI